MTPTAEEILAENRKLKRLRGMVTLATTLILHEDMPLAEAVRLIQGVRGQALELFPGKERTWDILYAPRFARILQERYGVDVPEA